MLRKYHFPDLVEAGIDEAGRGCFAGPVVAAAVIFDKSFSHPDLNDSKLVPAKVRTALRKVIEMNAIDYSVAMVHPEEIDELNILNATYLAMNKAVSGLKTTPEVLLVDGNRFRNSSGIRHLCLIKGDQQYQAIAAASILAKTYRDEYMLRISKEYPDFHWEANKGYPTSRHKAAIARHGITKYHRKSFNLNEQLNLFR